MYLYMLQRSPVEQLGIHVGLSMCQLQPRMPCSQPGCTPAHAAGRHSQVSIRAASMMPTIYGKTLNSRGTQRGHRVVLAVRIP